MDTSYLYNIIFIQSLFTNNNFVWSFYITLFCLKHNSTRYIEYRDILKLQFRILQKKKI